MYASTSVVSGRGSRGPRGPRRKRGGDRRTHGRLRDLCDEVLASYRVAQGEDFVTKEDRQVAEQILRNITPTVVP